MDGVAVEFCDGQETQIFHKLILQTSSWCLDMKFIDLIFLVLGSDSGSDSGSSECEFKHLSRFYFPAQRWK